MPNIVLPAWGKVVNEEFIPLLKNKDRYLILYGGRGSSKSVFIAKKLIARCMKEKYFRFILYRKVYSTIKESQYQTIKDIIYDYGLQDLFKFNENPLAITYLPNGNKFLCRGGDDPKKLKSIKDPTGVWYEEEIPSEADFITITTSIRTTKAYYLQECFTINPEVEGDYTQHWFWKRFFKGQNNKTFSAKTTVEFRLGNDTVTHDLTYTCHHSTYIHNRWIPISFMAFLAQLQVTNEYYYTIYALGMWGNKRTDGQFYKLFSYARNCVANGVTDTGQPELYNNTIALHVTFDFNLHPFVTLLVHQVVGKTATQIDEICLPTPNNYTNLACREFARRYASHTAGLFVYGDPNGRKEDSAGEKGHNNYKVIQQELAKFRPQLRVFSAAPSVTMRGQFINTVFATGYMGAKIIIGYNCVNTTNDYLYLKEAGDGTKSKTKVENKETGVRHEEYGHCSDANDYFYCFVFAAEYASYQNGGQTAPKVSTGKNVSNNDY